MFLNIEKSIKLYKLGKINRSNLFKLQNLKRTFAYQCRKCCEFVRQKSIFRFKASIEAAFTRAKVKVYKMLRLDLKKAPFVKNKAYTYGVPYFKNEVSY